jgi:hypothetical protein
MAPSVFAYTGLPALQSGPQRFLHPEIAFSLPFLTNGPEYATIELIKYRGNRFFFTSCTACWVEVMGDLSAASRLCQPLPAVGHSSTE